MNSSRIRTARSLNASLSIRGACVPGGHAWHALPPVNRITDMSENITFQQLRLWVVKTLGIGAHPLGKSWKRHCKGSGFWHTVLHNWCRTVKLWKIIWCNLHTGWVMCEKYWIDSGKIWICHLLNDENQFLSHSELLSKFEFNADWCK